MVTASRTLLNFVVFSNLFCPKSSFQPQRLLDSDKPIFPGIRSWLARQKPEKGDGSESKALSRLELRLHSAHCSLLCH